MKRRPRRPDALARRRRGKLPADRGLPGHLCATTFFQAPDRLLRSHRLSPAARLVGFAVCAAARDGAVACDPSNDDLAAATGLKPRAVQEALVDLETAGFIHRLDRRDLLALDSLELVGYRDPWEARGRPRPPRALVLCWRLPEPDPALREGAASCAPLGARRCARGDEKGGRS